MRFGVIPSAWQYTVSFEDVMEFVLKLDVVAPVTASHLKRHISYNKI